ncbi:MAG: hypothetical protein ABIV94_06020 [Acidimicrobiales bacterium]
MPDWEPNREDVHFDRLAAAAAVAACDRATAIVEDVTERFAGARRAAVEEWMGPHRHRFDDDVARLGSAIDQAVSSIEAARRRLSEGDEWAAVTQRSREAQRAQWAAERAAEAPAGRRAS